MIEPLPNCALDLGERGVKGFGLVHGGSFNETQGSLGHYVAPYD